MGAGFSIFPRVLARSGVRIAAALAGIFVGIVLAVAFLDGVFADAPAIIVVNIIVSGVSVDGVGDYFLAGIIIWICTAVADVIGGRMIRERRRS